MKRFLGALAIAACVVLTSPNSGAATLTQAQRVPAARTFTVATPGVNAGPVHRVFGWLVNANGSLLTIQLRGGRLLKVDASQASALNRVSEPLSRGKPTVVTGTISAGVLYATSVVRAAPQSASWDVDR